MGRTTVRPYKVMRPLQKFACKEVMGELPRFVLDLWLEQAFEGQHGTDDH
jgi:hypothetical protein